MKPLFRLVCFFSSLYSSLGVSFCPSSLVFLCSCFFACVDPMLARGCGWRRADLLGDDRALWEHSWAAAKDVSEEARVVLSGDRITRTHSAGRSLIVDGRTGVFFSCGSKKVGGLDGTKGVEVGAAQRSSLVQHHAMQARPLVGSV